MNKKRKTCKHPNVSEEERGRRSQQMKTDPAFDRYKGMDGARYTFAMSLSQAYYIAKETKRRGCSRSDVIRSCIDYIIDNNIIIN